MQISSRLSMIADMVSPGNRLVDVGCDHGYLPVSLILEKKIPSAIAMDVRSGPLSRAKEHIEEYGLGRYIETRLSDGLAGLRPGEGDSLVIAGMGGPLMERILTDGAAVRDSFREMILQPQSDIPHFRRFLHQIGWKIIREEMILEDGKYYPMMKVIPTDCGEETADWTEEEYAYGKFLLEQKAPVLKQYLERELRIRDGILKNLKKSDSNGASERRQIVEEERLVILKAIERYS